jgi:hypothetical protein
VSRGKPCTICTGENTAQVNSLIASGIKLKDIAAQTGASPYALSRHKRNCLTPTATTPTGDGALALWLQRADDLYNASGAALDLRGQAQAITTAFRALEIKRKHEEKTQEQEARELPTDTRLWTDDEGDKFRAWLDALICNANEKKTQGVV